jgi:hypothetical protein
MGFQATLGTMRRLMPRVMRRLVMRPGARARLRMGLVRRARRLVVMLARRLMMRLARPVGLARRPVSVMMRRPGMGFRLFHEDDGRSGRSHANKGGEAEEKGTAAYLLRLGRGVHRASPKV